MPTYSQPTMGLLRDILTEMNLDGRSITECNTHWKNRLFDFGMRTDVIDIMVSHNFRWTNIVPDLYERRFGDNRYFAGSVGLPAYEQGAALDDLVRFALTESESRLVPELRKALTSDGFTLSVNPAVDSEIPKELRDLPGLETLHADLNERLKSGLVALLFIDLDNFKTVNDQLGSHAEGDKCLVRAVAEMAQVIIHKGKLYRRSGDEFIVILPNFDLREAAAVAERIRASIEQARPGGAVKVTASIGVATSQSSGITDAKSLEASADTAMYAAKETKNRVVALP
jgi:diguanylate cyclase (GGDEF)-like protein